MMIMVVIIKFLNNDTLNLKRVYGTEHNHIRQKNTHFL
jgi:hypothetical protein